jgi:serine/threonine protein kinase
MNQVLESADLRSVVEDRIDRWHQGAKPDAARVLADHPEIESRRTLVLDLVWEEYTLRTSAGDEVSKSHFYERFPKYRRSIAKLLEVEDGLVDRRPPLDAEQVSARWPLSGEDLLGYDIVEPLGRGGLARVFLAREREVGGRFVVIKASMFGGQEANALGKLSHPGIVPIHSVQRDDERGLTVICMPLLGVATAVDLLDAAFSAGLPPRDGEVIDRVAQGSAPVTSVPRPSAGKAISYEKLPYSEAIARLGLELAEALTAAHAAGIQHRDIKPSNILLAWSGRPMLLDFNLSVDAAATGSRVGGTLAYMAPELIECLVDANDDEARRFNPRADIYSLGVVLYELLTGKLPAKPLDAERLEPDDYESWLASKRQPIAGDLEADPNLQQIVLKCLSADPAARYASASELATELRNCLATHSVAARRVRRRRGMVFIAALALLGGAGGSAAYVGTRPPYADLLYKKALVEYDNGDFEKATQTFTECMQYRPGWPNAIFGRAQSLRRAEHWKEARTDYMALEPSDRAWAFALSGYCNMRLKYYTPAVDDFRRAHDEGLRDIGFLLNYANSEVLRQAEFRAVPIYSEVLEIEPENTTALRNRGLAYAAMVLRKKEPPNRQAFDDAKKYCELEPKCFEASLCAATIFGDAAKKDAKYEEAAAGYLADALIKRMPIEWVSGPVLRPLLDKVSPEIRSHARSKNPNEVLELRPINEPLLTADWNAFQKETHQ